MVREILGVAFVVVGVVWGWRMWRVYRQERERGTLGATVDFVASYAIDLVLIVGLVCLGFLLITGHWWNP